MSSQTQKGGSLREMSAQKKRKKLPQEMRVIGNLIIGVPGVSSVLYSIGAMRFANDQMDTIISTSCVILTLCAFAMLNWSWYYLENSGE